MHAFRIADKQGHKAFFDGRLVDVAELGEAIIKGSYPALLKEAMARYGRGESLTFGKLSLEQGHIKRGKRVLPLEELESAEIRGGTLYIQQTGKKITWAQVLISDLPNAFVLVGMLDHLKGSAS